jgi:hypothetical protein
MNYKMVKSGMRVLIGIEKTDVADADVVVGWKLQPATRIVVGEGERKKLTWRKRKWNPTRRPLEPRNIAPNAF